MLPAAKDQPAYVLHRRAFRETSVIVELLTADFGRVAGVVRGVKGGRRPRYSIEPFTMVSVAWRGRGQLVNILAAESIAATRLQGDALFAGLYLNELLIKTLRTGRAGRCPLSPLWPTTRWLRLQTTTMAWSQRCGRFRERPARRTRLRHRLRRRHPQRRADRGPTKVYLAIDGEGFREATAGEVQNGADKDPVSLSGTEILAIANEDFARSAVRGAAKRVLRRALKQRLAGKPLQYAHAFREPPAPARPCLAQRLSKVACRGSRTANRTSTSGSTRRRSSPRPRGARPSRYST